MTPDDEEYCQQDMDSSARQILRGAGAVIVSVLVILAAAVMAFGADNITDLKELHKVGGIAAAEWVVTNPATLMKDATGTVLPTSAGFDFTWHVNQVKAGRRFIPSIYLPVYDPVVDDMAKAGCWAKILAIPNAANLQWLSSNNVPICLRHNNIPDAFTANPGRYRLPLTDDNRLKSALVWRRLATGALDDVPQADPLGPTNNWSNEGALIGASNYIKALQQYHQNPAWVEFAENNEQVFYDGFWTIANPNAMDKATGCYLNPTWKTPDQIAAVSLRHADWLAANPGLTPIDYFAQHFNRYRPALYQAYFAGLRSSLTPAWSANLRTAAYSATGDPTYPVPPSIRQLIGTSPEGLCYDGIGPPWYMGNNVKADLTDPGLPAMAMAMRDSWNWLSNRNPRAYREIWLWIGQSAAVSGALAGKHEIITPERYSALCEFIAWQCRADNGGSAVILRHWNNSKVYRAQPFFIGFSTQLATLGRSDLMTTTEEDYVNAVVSVPDRIMADATVPNQYGPRDFWLKGTTVPVTYSSGPQSAWFSAVKMPDGAMLIYGFSPVANPGKFTVNVQGIGAVPFDFKGACRKYQMGQQVGYQWSDLP